MATRDLNQVGWGYQYGASPYNDGSAGLLTTLWADLRRKQLPKSETSEDDAWYEEQQDERRFLAERMGRAHNIDVDRRENFRRRYWNS